jgi:hypothetical protein
MSLSTLVHNIKESNSDMLASWVMSINTHLLANADICAFTGGVLMLVPTPPFPTPFQGPDLFAAVHNLLATVAMRDLVVKAWLGLDMDCEFRFIKHGKTVFFPLCTDNDQRKDLCVALPTPVPSASIYTSVGRRGALLTMLVSPKTSSKRKR